MEEQVLWSDEPRHRGGGDVDAAAVMEQEQIEWQQASLRADERGRGVGAVAPRRSRNQPTRRRCRINEDGGENLRTLMRN